jgi:hypothetical protein
MIELSLGLLAVNLLLLGIAIKLVCNSSRLYHQLKDKQFELEKGQALLRSDFDHYKDQDNIFS